MVLKSSTFPITHFAYDGAGAGAAKSVPVWPWQAERNSVLWNPLP